jgi:hypothetical protein
MRLRKIIASVVATALVGTTLAVTGVTMSASADTIGQAWIIMQDGNPGAGAGVSNWNATDAAGSISITGNGDYSLTLNVPDGCGAEQVDFLGISTDINIYEQDASETEIYKDMQFNITSIVADGTTIAYNGPGAGAHGTNDDGSTYRLSIYDTWSDRNTQDIDNKFSCAEYITINFTVTGIKDAATDSGDSSTEAATTTAADSSSDSTDAAATTTTAKDGDSSTEATTTTTADDSSSSAATTTTAKSSSTKSDSKSDSSSDDDSTDDTVAVGNPDQGETSDAGVAGVVLVFALAGVGAVATRKKI